MRRNSHSPVTVDVACTKRKRVMHKRRIHCLGGTLGHVQEVREVAEMAEATADSVARAILIKHEYLTW